VDLISQREDVQQEIRGAPPRLHSTPIGYAEGDPETTSRLAAFRQGLEKRKWAEGRNVHIDYRFAAASADQYRALAKEIIALKPDVILAHTTPITAALQRESSALPIVFVNVSDPVGSSTWSTIMRSQSMK
jgi:putative tryptophan/tyrosine transport system substrate-binding protein